MYTTRPMLKGLWALTPEDAIGITVLGMVADTMCFSFSVDKTKVIEVTKKILAVKTKGECLYSVVIRPHLNWQSPEAHKSLARIIIRFSKGD